MKRFISGKRSILLMMAIICILGFAGGCKRTGDITDSETTSGVDKKEKWTQVGKDIFVFTGDFYLVNMVLVTSGKEAVLVDAGMNEEEGQRIADFMKERKLQLKNIIITHMHGDHTGNLAKLRPKDMIPVMPENAEDGQIVKLGDKNLRIIFTEGHYNPKGHISVEVEDENILIAGDIICNNILPPVASGGNIDELLKTLKILQDKNYSQIIPGHGEVVDKELLFKRQFEYLNNARDKVEKLIQDGGITLDLKNIKLTDCMEDTSYLYKERLEYWHIKNLETIYSQLKP